MREFGSRFVPLGEIVDIRFGVKSGCDAFFMPRGVTADALERFPGARDFKHRFGVDREAVAEERVKIVRAGDGSEHPIEAEYVEPEIHSLMALDRPLVKHQTRTELSCWSVERLMLQRASWSRSISGSAKLRPFRRESPKRCRCQSVRRAPHALRGTT